MDPLIDPSMDSLTISREEDLMEGWRNHNEEELLVALKPIVTSRDLLTQYTASFQAPHKFDYRLEVSATCDKNHYFVPRYLKPEICEWPEPIGTLTTKELFRQNRCRIMVEDLDDHSLMHLRGVIRFIIEKSRGTAKEIEIRFLHSRCIWSAKMLMEWFTIFREFGHYLSGHISFDEQRSSVVGILYYTQDPLEVSNHEKQEKRFLRHMAKSGIALHNQHGPVRGIDQEWQDEDWVRVVHALILRLKPTHHHQWSRVKDLYSTPRREDDGPTRTLVDNMQAYLAYRWPSHIPPLRCLEPRSKRQWRERYARLYLFSPLDERPATGDHTYQTPDQSEDEGER
ncbi:hypothetical protein BDZ85DRAFT_306618 [Elsinoe ampelina]|uniref:Uncharacterized protein n=1 Tax=Elsinoe ampelina TaxID=302913 RepID=A0A6A6G062_9PEZI|nr:hypothetical protein BDZ85DRAFT_306618 [Elsinoe ampelina]